jgi:predicted transcriptional regulator
MSPLTSRLMVMPLTLHLPEELARRVTKAAAARHQTPEQVALEAIEAQLPPEEEPGALEAFIGSGASGRGDLALRHREILAEELADKTARDI